MSIVENTLEKLRGNGPPAGRPHPAASSRGGAGEQGSFAARIAARPEVQLQPARLREHGMLPPTPDERRLMIQYREIKRALLSALTHADGEGGPDRNLIMVASAQAGEGKTFTSYNLARSLATERDWTTLLIDADVARRHLTSALGLEGQPGLVDVLTDPVRELLDVIYRTSVPGLLFIPAGSLVDNATELLASARMREIVRGLQEANSGLLAVFDSSPVLPTPESRALADNVGQIVFVVRAEHTLRADVEAAIALIGDGRQVGVVLNQYRGELPTRDYYGNSDASAAPAV